MNDISGPPPLLEPLVTAKALAETLSTRVNTVYDLAAAGKLPSYRVPGVGRRFRVSEVEAWLERCREQGRMNG